MDGWMGGWMDGWHRIGTMADLLFGPEVTVQELL